MYIGIDFGGTNIRAAVVDKSGNLIHKNRIRTGDTSNYSVFLKRFIDFIQSTKKDFDIKGIGIGFPGSISKQQKIIVAPNLGWKNIDLRSDLSSQLNIPVILDNDVNMAICGEKWLGAAQDFSDFFMLTIGTGVGGAFFVGNNIYTGTGNNAGEIGHINIEPGGIECACGKKGCLEQYASATALINFARRNLITNKESLLNDIELKDIEAQHIYDAGKQGDRFALQAIDYNLKNLAIGIAAVVNLMNPQAIIIGGGVSHAGDFLLKRLRPFLKYYCLDFSYKDLVVRLASLGDEAGIFGSVYRHLK